MDEATQARKEPAQLPLQAPPETQACHLTANGEVAVRSDPPFCAVSSDDQAKAYAEDTRDRGSRAKPSPTIEKYRDQLKRIIPHKPNKKVLFEDLISSDPSALDEFGPGGYKKFNARLNREL